jgi:hypothetical protein
MQMYIYCIYVFTQEAVISHSQRNDVGMAQNNVVLTIRKRYKS